MTSRLGVVVHAYNPSTLGGRGRIRRLRPIWTTWWNPISTKNTKNSWVWWQTPVVSATQEAEVEGSLEPWRLRLQWAVIAPLHSGLGDSERHCLKTKNDQKKKITLAFFLGIFSKMYSLWHSEIGFMMIWGTLPCLPVSLGCVLQGHVPRLLCRVIFLCLAFVEASSFLLGHQPFITICWCPN